ncbi:hypothetical protein HU200_047464 [Digitaria exilis]|uniref:Cytochrome P450 n=1 Tax=Digitaria exilis TaxID=1010633 RepID=A0A835AUC8_9POAL|nr:hypothetical protein HU200_047464 [Digitaria exilis]
MPTQPATHPAGNSTVLLATTYTALSVAAAAAAASSPSLWSLFMGLLAVLVAWGAYWAAERYWLRPRRLDRALRAQGLTGTEYRFPAGDLVENARLNEEARSKPMKPCHDVVPRVLPHVLHTVKEHGTLIVVKDRWESKLASSDAPYELDIWPEFQNLTGDVISRTAFGSSFLEGRRIFQLQGEQAEPRPLIRRNNRRMNEINGEIEGILRGMVEKRERAIESGEASGNDLLGLLLQSNMDSGKGSLRLSTEDVIEECKLFYFAGMETTSVLLTWTLVVLGMHPEWQDRAREEVLAVFGKDDKPNFDGLSRLKTASVTMILYEVLRLYPPAVTLNRRTFKDMQIGGITYPAGVILELPIIVVHHNPDVWGKDVHEFKPQRFAEGISKATKDDQPAFFPFGRGPRICIGQNFALLEAKMALSMILQRFEFQLSPSYTHAPYTVITLHPQHGAPIIVKKI